LQCLKWFLRTTRSIAPKITRAEIPHWDDQIPLVFRTQLFESLESCPLGRNIALAAVLGPGQMQLLAIHDWVQHRQPFI
jgi:hypothetical protein